MQHKKCFKCGKEKPLSDFYVHSRMADGHLNKCKKCTKKDVKEHRQKNLEKIREYDRNRGHSKKRIAKNTDITKKYRNKFPERYKAYSMVARAVRSGKLKKPERCEVCSIGSRQIEGHHNDYSRPLDVIWMCSDCHSKFHSVNK